MYIDQISCLRVDMYEYSVNKDGEFLRAENAIHRAWIPQTMGDQIWVVLGFGSKAERLEWEGQLPGKVAKWLDRSLLPKALSFGWGSRNANGFIVRGKEGDFTDHPSVMQLSITTWGHCLPGQTVTLTFDDMKLTYEVFSIEKRPENNQFLVTLYEAEPM